MTAIILVPSAPQNFNVMVTSSTTVTVSWERPSVTNGIISHYTLYYHTDAVEYSMIVAYNGEMVRTHKYIAALVAMKTCFRLSLR